MIGIKTSDVRTVYHASNHLFTKPDIDMIQKNRINHENGMLGLFFSTTKDKWFHGFGSNIYDITIPPHFKPLVMTVKDFFKLSQAGDNDPVDYFKYHRQRLLESGVDYILVEEYDGSSGMGVFINLDIEMRLQNEKKTSKNNN